MKLKADWIFQGASIVTALATVFVGWKALSVSRRTMELTYDHNKRSVRPRLGLFIHRRIEKDGFYVKVSVRNAGIGPAIISRITLKFDGVSKVNFEAEELRELLLKALKDEFMNSTVVKHGSLAINDALLSGEDHCVAEVFVPDLTPTARSRAEKVRNRFSLVIDYKSIYDEEFVFES